MEFHSQWEISRKTLSLGKKRLYSEKDTAYFISPTLNNWKPSFPANLHQTQRCSVGLSLFKDSVFFIFLPIISFLMVEFCNRFGVGHRWQQLEGIPGGLGVKKPSEACCTALMWANGNHKDLTVFWHVIGCWTCGFLSGAPLPHRGGNEKEEMVASQGSGISVYCWILRDLNEKPPFPEVILVS